MKKIVLTILAFAVIACLAGCNPPEKKDTEETTTAVTTTVETAYAVSETTTSRLGGFIVYDELPEDGDSWEDFSE